MYGEFRAWRTPPACAARYRSHIPLRAGAYYRQSAEQYDHRFPCLNGFLEARHRGLNFFGFNSQARIFLEQQDHRQPDSEPCLVNIDRAHYRRATHGYTGVDSRSGGTELSTRGNADCRSTAYTGKSYI